jgi:hypothetical protein
MSVNGSRPTRFEVQHTYYVPAYYTVFKIFLFAPFTFLELYFL